MTDDDRRKSASPSLDRRASPDDAILPIDQAPYRIRREYYRRERRNSAIAILVILGVLAAITYAIARLVAR